MPYLNETASRNSQVATALDELVVGALGEYRIATDAVLRPENIADFCIPLDELPYSVHPDEVRASVSIDGSRQDTPIMRDGSHRVSVCYVRVGTVTLDLERFRALRDSRFIDPVEERASRHQTTLNYALPGVGLTIGDLDPLDSWREATDRMLARIEFTDEILPTPRGEAISFADVLLMLYGDRPGHLAETVPIRRCPVCGAVGDGPIAHVGRDGGACPDCGGVLYLVDWFGLDETFVNSGRENALNSVMNSLERLALVASVELMRRRDPAELGRTLLVADGPLAAIASLQRLARPILGYLDGVAAELDERNLPQMLVVGVEKGGNFAGHGEQISDLIPPGHAMALSADYISRHITGRVGGRAYGVGHMYGRRFFYRRRDGHLLTVTVPAIAGVPPWSNDPASERWESYPTLRTTLEVLESLSDRRFRDAVLPLSLAHGASSIGLSADTVLSVLAQGALGITRNTRLKVARY